MLGKYRFRGLNVYWAFVAVNCLATKLGEHKPSGLRPPVMIQPPDSLPSMRPANRRRRAAALLAGAAHALSAPDPEAACASSPCFRSDAENELRPSIRDRQPVKLASESRSPERSGTNSSAVNVGSPGRGTNGGQCEGAAAIARGEFSGLPPGCQDAWPSSRTS